MRIENIIRHLRYQNCSQSLLTRRISNNLIMDVSCAVIQCPDSGDFEVTDAAKAAYDKYGFILVRQLLTQKELETVKATVESPDGVRQYAYGRESGEGQPSKIALWQHPGDDVTGLLARCQKVAGTAETLLGGEAYHYHCKLLMKEPHGGGQWLWHQDYGYWYMNGNLRPDMLTVFVAVDQSVEANGCLRVIPGSHLSGRIDHEGQGDQQRANQERVDRLLDRLGEFRVEQQPGDVLFFHSNLLHTSGPNCSDLRRWCLAIAYNRADNDPVYRHHHPQYTKLHKVPNAALLACQCPTKLDGKDFLTPDKESYPSR